MTTPVLSLRPDRQLCLDHEGVRYEPLADDAALGALLLALDLPPLSFGGRLDDRAALQLSAATARQFALILDRHATRRDRAQPRLPAQVSLVQARAWVQAAGKAVPAVEHERFLWRITRRLGDDPWCDGSPPVLLDQQQFGLFAAKFDDGEAGAAADE